LKTSSDYFKCDGLDKLSTVYMLMTDVNYNKCALVL